MSIGTILGGAAGFALGGLPGAAIGATLGGGYDSSNAARDAANTQAQASREASAQAAATFDKQAALQEPFRINGLAGSNRLAELMGLNGNGSTPGYGELARSFTANDFTADPGYQFRLGEGMKGVENSAAARGSLLSGGTLKALQKYGQDFASNEYQNVYNRFNNDQTNKYNRLAGVAGSGQTATNTLTNAAGNYGQAVQGNILGAANAQAAGQVGAANAWSGAIGQGINGYQQNELMKMIANRVPYNYQTTIPMQPGGGY